MVSAKRPSLPGGTPYTLMIANRVCVCVSLDKEPLIRWKCKGKEHSQVIRVFMWVSVHFVSDTFLLWNVPLTHIGRDTDTHTWKNHDASTCAVLHTHTVVESDYQLTECLWRWHGIRPTCQHSTLWTVLLHGQTIHVRMQSCSRQALLHVLSFDYTYGWTGCEKPKTHLHLQKQIQGRTGCFKTTGSMKSAWARCGHTHHSHSSPSLTHTHTKVSMSGGDRAFTLGRAGPGCARASSWMLVWMWRCQTSLVIELMCSCYTSTPEAHTHTHRYIYTYA